MKVLQIVSIILPLVCLFGLGEAYVSNINCADEYLKCIKFENSNNPMGMATVSKRCKDQIRGLEVCQGKHAWNDPSQNSFIQPGN